MTKHAMAAQAAKPAAALDEVPDPVTTSLMTPAMTFIMAAACGLVFAGNLAMFLLG